MVLMNVDFSLPLKNPVIIFSLVLFIILVAPLVLNKIRVPHIIGLIVAGIIIGPYGFNLMLRDSSIVLFGTVGLLYIMFTAGLEIDLQEFRINKIKSLVFGLYTFTIPMCLGSLVSYYFLSFDLGASLLLGSMLASHTLLAYPIASRYGLTRTRSVTLTIGGTIITDILALLVLAAIIGTHKGEVNGLFWMKLIVSSLVFAAIVFFIFPIVARWFFKKFDDSISQYIFVLAIVFIGSVLAEVAGLEAIIGAFLSGLAINRFIPHSSPLMNRINFVGNALFIPFFLIGVGMLVDFRVLFDGFGSLKVAAVMITIAVTAKYLAAHLTKWTFKLSTDEKQLIFGLSNARVGATLAVVLVAYNIILGETNTGQPIRLLNEDVLNGTIIMILVTCTISSLTVEKASRNLALKEDNKDIENDATEHRVLISLAYPDSVKGLVDLAILLSKNDNSYLYALHVVDESKPKGTLASVGKKMIEEATRQASSTDMSIIPLTRFDVNISNGIVYTVKEHGITDVIIGLHHLADEGVNFLGQITENILQNTSKTIFIYKAVQPLNIMKRLIVAVPANAEYEEGFFKWFTHLQKISNQSGLPISIYGNEKTMEQMAVLNNKQEFPLMIDYHLFENWEDFLILSREVQKDDLFIIVSSRSGYLSYTKEVDRLPKYLMRYFVDNSYIIIYPEQARNTSTVNIMPVDDSIELFGKAGKIVEKIFTPSKRRE